ncbi:hypothetical protein NG791_10545 [Laspinema sp. D1]|uniref:hypothetical protein n=1 Tax=Laspinema palackyanum TaxID=3231601 RepID=UPI00349416E0|nr:hypothetical protein [Laspinema sp. D2b]
MATELGDGVILIKDETTGEPIGMEILSYKPSDNRLNAVTVEMGRGDRQQAHNCHSYPVAPATPRICANT